MSLSRFTVVSLALSVACGGPSKKGAGSDSRDRPELERRWPALRYVPADAEFVSVAARITDVSVLAGEIVTALAIASHVDDASIAEQMRGVVGFDLSDAPALASAGFDADGSLALFAEGEALVLVVPISDAGAASSTLDAARAQSNASSSAYRGHQVYSMPSDAGTIAWVLLGDWLLVRLGPDSAPSWIDSSLDAASGTSVASTVLLDPAIDLAKAQGMPEGSILGAGAVAAVPHLAPECQKTLASVASRVALAASPTWQEGKLVIRAPLAPEAISELASNTDEPGPPGFVTLAQAASVWADLRVDTQWLAGKFAPCGATPPPPSVLGAPPRSLHVAIDQIDPDAPGGKLAAFLHLADRRPVDAMLDQIPMRSLVESRTTIAGVTAMLIDVPGVPNIYYSFNGPRLTVALGKAHATAALQAGGPSDDALARVGLRPGQLRNLDDLLTMAYQAMGYSSSVRRAAEEQARRLRRYREVVAQARLDGDALEISVSMALAD